MQPQQLRNAAQDEEANENSCCHDDKKRCEHDNDEEQIRCTGALWRGGVGEKKLIIALIRFEPKGKCVAQTRNDPNDLVNQNMERHPRQQNFWKTTAGRLNQDQRGNDRRRCIANTGNQTDERIESKLKLRVWKCDQLVHHDRDPTEKRLQTRALVLFFRRKDFPFRLNHIGLRAHTIKVRPSRRSREFIAATRSRFSGVMVRYLFFSCCQKKRPAIFMGKKRTTNGSQERRW